MTGDTAELLSFLRRLEPPLSAEVGSETALLSSGLLDSLAVFRLLEWIEGAVGAPVDPTSVDVLAEWDTPAAVEAFVRRARNGGPP